MISHVKFVKMSLIYIKQIYDLSKGEINVQCTVKSITALRIILIFPTGE